jgi:hypothetical protein
MLIFIITPAIYQDNQAWRSAKSSQLMTHAGSTWTRGAGRRCAPKVRVNLGPLFGL